MNISHYIFPLEFFCYYPRIWRSNDIIISESNSWNHGNWETKITFKFQSLQSYLRINTIQNNIRFFSLVSHDHNQIPNYVYVKWKIFSEFEKNYWSFRIFSPDERGILSNNSLKKCNMPKVILWELCVNLFERLMIWATGVEMRSFV